MALCILAANPTAGSKWGAIMNLTRRRQPHSRQLGALLATLFIGGAFLGAQTTHTTHQVPDLQGTWSFATLTPMERPAEFKDKAVLTEEEAREYAAQRRERQNMDRRDGGGAADVSRAYNDFWWDFGTTASLRTSLVIDPPDGRIPPLTPEAQQRLAALGARLQRPAEGPEDRGLAERCLLGFNAGPPITPSAYNNNLQIVQTRDYIVIHTEMVHEARIVPLDGRPRQPHVPRWTGESRGRWEGDTLVIETANFRGETAFRGSSANLKLTERLKRDGPDTLLYQFTVEDPTTWTAPWTAEIPLARTSQQIYEYACHEGNYGMEGILRGARAEEGSPAASSR
jgi:hypothetical protein